MNQPASLDRAPADYLYDEGPEMTIFNPGQIVLDFFGLEQIVLAFFWPWKKYFGVFGLGQINLTIFQFSSVIS